jgi:chromate transporter
VFRIKKTKAFYRELFFSTFSLSAFTFGGGYVIIPLMRKKFVEKLKWIEEEEMLDYVAIAQSSPGPIAVNTSILVGFRLAGILGAVIAVLGTVLPPLIVLSVITYLYAAFINHPVVAATMYGMRLGVAAVLIDAVISLVKAIAKEKSLLSLLVLIAAFVCVHVFDIHVLIVLAGAAVIGLVSTFIKARTLKNGGEAE